MPFSGLYIYYDVQIIRNAAFRIKYFIENAQRYCILTNNQNRFQFLGTNFTNYVIRA